MNTEEKIEAIKMAIDKAEQFQSKLTDAAKDVPFLGSLKIRALLNNIGEIGNHYGDWGCHKAGSMCSAIYGNDNLKYITAIDSWESDHMEGDKAYPVFVENVAKFKPKNSELNVIIEDVFKVDLSLIKHKVDIYSYDCGHSYLDQKMALTYYKPILADEFIYLCDDWTYGEVKEGTMDGIKEGGYEILFEKELLNETQGNDLHLNMEWWRGYYVALLKNKK